MSTYVALLNELRAQTLRRQRIRKLRFSTYLAHLIALDALRSRYFIRGSQLPAQYLSSWYHIFENGDDGTFLSLVGLNKRGFLIILNAFDATYVVSSGKNLPGRPRTVLAKHAILACLLHRYRTGAPIASLAAQFCTPPSTLQRNLEAAEEALHECLQSVPDAAIKWPTFQQQRKWAALVEAKEPLIKGCWGFIDGKNYHVAKPGSSDIQNAYYNGMFNKIWLVKDSEL